MLTRVNFDNSGTNLYSTGSFLCLSRRVLIFARAKLVSVSHERQVGLENKALLKVKIGSITVNTQVSRKLKVPSPKSLYLINS